MKGSKLIQESFQLTHFQKNFKIYIYSYFQAVEWEELTDQRCGKWFYLCLAFELTDKDISRPERRHAEEERGTSYTVYQKSYSLC